MASSSGPVLLVDGDCGVCCWIGLKLAARVEGLQVTPIQSALGGRLLDGMPEDRAMATWHLHAGERTVSGAEVIGGLLDVRGNARAARIARRAQPLLAPAYRFGARHRDVWARVVPRSARQRSRARVLKG